MNKNLALDSFKHIYVFLDFDETLISNNKKRLLFEPKIVPILQKLKEKNVKLLISSRNQQHIVKDLLAKHNLLIYFEKIIADYRNKKYHIKQVIMNENFKFTNQTLILFIDDHLANCIEINELASNLELSLLVINYKSVGPHNLENILSLLLNEEFQELEKIAFKKMECDKH